MSYTNVVSPLTSFIGRRQEIVAVKQLLAQARLLTLTGAGGCGKTRLAVQTALELAEADVFVDGVWWIELASLSDATFVPQSVARALGVSGAPDQPLIETLASFLKTRHLLLVIDNCEHLLKACAQLVETMLLAAPDVRILATSREPLAVAGETIWLTPSLSTPDPEHLSRPPADLLSDLAEYDAIHLFVERAASVRPTFALTRHNAAAVTRTCHRLDGIPLAIELAAARVNVLTVDQIAARLDNCMTLLASGSRTALLPRHRTLRATIDWSHDLLPDEERTLFRRLSALAGGFTLEAAEAICAEGGLAHEEILDVLSHLVNKSLVVAETEERSEARYRLLEPIRQYAWEQLVESGEEALVRERHLNWFLALAEQAEAEWRGPSQKALLDQLETEHDNLRAALEWSNTDEDKTEARLRLAGALSWFWNVRGYLSEGRRWLEDALTRTEESAGRTLARAKALYGAGVLAFTQGDYVVARPRLEESVTIWQERGDQRGLAHSLVHVGLVALRQGDYASAHSRLEESRALFEEVEDQWGVALALNHLGNLASRQRDYAAAHSLLTGALALCRAVGDKRLTATSLNNLGEVARCEDDDERASVLYEEALALRRELNDKSGIATTLHNLGHVLQHQRDHKKAAALLEESLAVYQEVGDKRGLGLCLAGLAGIAMQTSLGSSARYDEDLRRAVQLFGAADGLLNGISASLAPADRAEYDRNVATLRFQLGEAAYAAAWAEGRAMTLEQAIAEARMPAPVDLPPPSTLRHQPLLEPLTDRELEALRLVAEGLSDRQIAERMTVVVGTVKRHLNNVYGKLGVHRRTEAVARARELGLL